MPYPDNFNSVAFQQRWGADADTERKFLSKHTPGPWTIVSSRYAYASPNDLDLIDSNNENVPGVIVHIGSVADEAEAEANARLIAAAPELLEALHDTTASLVAAVSLLSRGGKKAAPSNKMFAQMLTDYNASITRALAVIARAKGETP